MQALHRSFCDPVTNTAFDVLSAERVPTNDVFKCHVLLLSHCLMLFPQQARQAALSHKCTHARRPICGDASPNVFAPPPTYRPLIFHGTSEALENPRRYDVLECHVSQLNQYFMFIL